MSTRATLLSLVTLVLGAGCGSYPAPVQRMADAESATRSARELGANGNPQAQLHLRLAEEEMAHAQKLVEDGDNKRADFVLVRARGDAELALALARQSLAEAEAQRAVGLATATQPQNPHGAQQ